MEHTLFLIIFIVFFVSLCICRDCVKKAACSCEFNDGSGIVDLSVIGHQDGTPLFKDIASGDGFVYSFNPCYPFNEGSCIGVVACQTSPRLQINYDIGDPNMGSFSFDGLNVVVTYPSNAGERTSIVTLACNQSVVNPYIIFQGEPPNRTTFYLFTLTSAAACPVSTSTPVPTPTQPNPHTVSPKPDFQRITTLLFDILLVTGVILAVVVVGLVAIVSILITKQRMTSKKSEPPYQKLKHPLHI